MGCGWVSLGQNDEMKRPKSVALFVFHVSKPHYSFVTRGDYKVEMLRAFSELNQAEYQALYLALMRTL